MEQERKWQEDTASIAQYLQKVPKRSREEAKSSFQGGHLGRLAASSAFPPAPLPPESNVKGTADQRRLAGKELDSGTEGEEASPSTHACMYAYTHVHIRTRAHPHRCEKHFQGLALLFFSHSTLSRTFQQARRKNNCDFKAQSVPNLYFMKSCYDLKKKKKERTGDVFKVRAEHEPETVAQARLCGRLG